MKYENKAAIVLALTALLAIAVVFGPEKPSKESFDPHFAPKNSIIYLDGRALIDLNSAGSELLCCIDGIGEKLSDRIIEYREENGPFMSLDELMNVNGIGEGKLESLSKRVCISR